VHKQRTLPAPGTPLSALAAAGLGVDQLQSLALDTGFQQRKARKIHPLSFLSLLLAESVKGDPSYRTLAARLETIEGVLVSRQAMWKKVGERCIAFLDAVLARAIAARLPESLRKCGCYRRVLVQDSTVIQLPSRLFGTFSGVSNAHASVCNARLQCVYDLMASQFVSFSLDPYSKNDQSAAPELELRAGDLALRDRGYLSGDEIQRHLDARADCIYRHKFNTAYLDPDTGKAIDLGAMLDRERRIDMEVLLNNAARTKIRLVAFPVPEEMANLRRMKLRKETRGHNPSKGLLHQLSWTIFVTTIPRTVVTAEGLAEMYGLRWRIETIFKAMKSNMSFARIHNVSEHQLRVLLAARLIMLVIINRFVYRPGCHRIRQDHGRELSLVKLTEYLVSNQEKIQAAIMSLHDSTGPDPALEAIAKYCTYDKRKRLNFHQKMEEQFASWPLG